MRLMAKNFGRQPKSDPAVSRKTKRAGVEADAQLAPQISSITTLSSVTINVLGLVLPLSMLQVYDRILPNQAHATLSALMMILAAAVLGDVMLRVARAYLVNFSVAQHYFRLGSKAMRHLLSQSSSAIEKTKSSVIIDRLNSLNLLQDYYGGQARLAKLDLPFAGLFLGLIWLIGGVLVLIPIVLFAMFGLIIHVLNQIQTKLLDRTSEISQRKYDFIIENLGAIHVLKALGMESQMERRYERIQKSTLMNDFKLILIGNINQAMSGFLGVLTMIAMVGFGAIFVINTSMSLGALTACTFLSGRAIQPLLRSMIIWANMQNISLARSKSLDLLADSEDAQLAMVPRIDRRIKKEALIFDKTCFGYGDGTSILSDADFRVPFGKMISLSGGDKSGRNTILRLITGERAPTSGQILYGDTPISANSTDPEAPLVAYADHEPDLIKGTILENITMFRPGATIDVARRAATLVGLDPYVLRLPAGYDTMLGENLSSILSPGLIQQIGIARALTMRADILILNEANTAFDRESDAKLLHTLKAIKGRQTIIIISRRPSLLKLADAHFEIVDQTIQQIIEEPSQNVGQPDIKVG